MEHRNGGTEMILKTLGLENSAFLKDQFFTKNKVIFHCGAVSGIICFLTFSVSLLNF